MRAFIFLLCTTVFGITAEKSFSQEKIRIDVDKLVSVDEVFDIIQHQTKYRFLYPDELFVDAPKVQLRKGEIGVDQLLRQSLSHSNVEFDLSRKNRIVIRERNVSDKAVEVFVPEQFEIAGTVLDEQGMPLPGASIVEKGTTNGTQTDFDGNFSITVANENAVLVVSYVGFATKEVAVNGQSDISITLAEDAAGLDEVVVIAYGTQKKSNLTAAVEMVDTKILKNRPVRTVSEMLEGAVPGLNVNLSSGAPDATANLNIRGFTGLNTTQSPLIMIDGVEQDINSINPNDVESISVLKDAAASAIYGSRAPFGVIIITTKRGKRGTPLRVNYSVTTQVNSPFKLPRTQNSLDFALDMNRAFYNSGQVSGFYPEGTIDKIRQYLNGEIPNNSRIGDRTGDGNMQWEAHSYAHGNTDYVGEAFKNNAFNINHDISVSGGDEKISYYLGLGKNSKEGIYATDLDHYDRYNGSLNIDADIKDWLNVGAKIRYAKTEVTRPNYRGSANTGNSDANFWNNISYFPNVPIKNPDGNYHWLSAFPVLEGLQGSFESEEDQVWLIPNINITPTKNLTMRVQYAYNTTSDEDLATTKEVQIDQGDGTFRRSARSAAYNDLTRNNGRRNYYQLDGNIEYKNSFGDHDFLVLLGAQQEYNRFKRMMANRRDLYSVDYPVLGNAYGNSFQLTERFYEWATRGVYFRASYNYKEKYLLDFNSRYDGSSRFNPDTRWSYLPSFSVGYNVAKEEFWPLKDLVNTFKLMGSWGRLGNQLLDVNGNNSTDDLVDLYTYLPVFTTSPKTSAVLEGDQQPSVMQPNLSRKDLTWEKPESIGFGVEAGLFGNRLKVDYQWYQRTTYDALGIAEQLPVVLGTAVPRANNAVFETRGWELSLNWKDSAFNIGDSPLQYGIRTTVSDYIGYVVEFGPGNESGAVSGTWTPGQVFGQIYGYKFQGIAQNPDEISNWIPRSNEYFVPGDVFYQDLDGDGIISSGSEGAWYSRGDTQLLGYDYPRYNYSIYMDAGWKGFNLSVFLDGVGKQSAWANNSRVFGHASTEDWSSRTAYSLHNELGYWEPHNTNAFFPRVYQNGKNSNLINDHYLINLAHLRIKNVNLSYNLPTRVVDQLGLNMVTFNLSVENLGFIYNKSWLDLDPTLLRRGVSGYPLSRTISFGFNIGF